MNNGESLLSVRMKLVDENKSLRLELEAARLELESRKALLWEVSVALARLERGFEELRKRLAS